MTKKLIYVCSPYSGNVEQNTINAREYCRFVAYCGDIPFAPHLLFTQFLDDSDNSERELAFEMNVEMIKRCDALMVFGDTISKGMEVEIKWAKDLGIPIYRIGFHRIVLNRNKELENLNN